MRENEAVYAPIFVSVIMILLLISDNIINTAVLNGADYYLSFTVVQLIVYMLPLAFYCKVRNVMFFKSLKFNLFSYRNLLLTVCLALLFLLGLLMFVALDLYYFQGIIYSSRVTAYSFVGEQHIYSVLGLIIVPAFLKELLFRGVVLSEYRTFGIVCAVIMSTLLFSFSEMSFALLPKHLYVGIFFGTICAVTDSVIPSIVLHMIYNTYNIYAENMVVNYIGKISDSAMPLFILGVLLLITVFFTFSVLESIYRKKACDCEENEIIKKLNALENGKTVKNVKEHKNDATAVFSKLILSPAFLVTAAIFLITATINVL
ncbi:MAG: CPBP family intramembrane metalloprotease [Ruminococcaceae bacterium]|nr:CPBP family intramembrane metalloprotease [Oscillospiraceae bacterium]